MRRLIGHARSHARRLGAAGAAVAVNILTSTTLRAAETPAPAAPQVDMTALIKLSLGLAVIMALIFGLKWFLRRFGGLTQSAAGQMRILGGLSVGSREKVILLQVGEEQLLVGVSPGRVQTLHVLDKPLDVTPVNRGGGKGSDTQGRPFAERLRQAMQQDEKR